MRGSGSAGGRFATGAAPARHGFTDRARASRDDIAGCVEATAVIAAAHADDFYAGKTITLSTGFGSGGGAGWPTGTGGWPYRGGGAGGGCAGDVLVGWQVARRDAHHRADGKGAAAIPPHTAPPFFVFFVSHYQIYLKL